MDEDTATRFMYGLATSARAVDVLVPGNPDPDDPIAPAFNMATGIMYGMVFSQKHPDLAKQMVDAVRKNSNPDLQPSLMDQAIEFTMEKYREGKLSEL